MLILNSENVFVEHEDNLLESFLATCNKLLGNKDCIAEQSMDGNFHYSCGDERVILSAQGVWYYRSDYTEGVSRGDSLEQIIQRIYIGL